MLQANGRIESSQNFLKNFIQTCTLKGIVEWDEIVNKYMPLITSFQIAKIKSLVFF